MTHVVLTGRNAKDELIEIADLLLRWSWSNTHFDRG